MLKRLAILTVLFLVAFAGIGFTQPPKDAMTAKNKAAADTAVSNTPSGQKQRAADAQMPGTVKGNDQPPSAKDGFGANQTKEDLEIQWQLAKFTKYLVWVGGVQALALLGSVVIIFYQAKLMGRQDEHLKNVADAAGENARAALAQSVRLTEQNKILEASVAIAQKNANAAEISAKAAMGVAVPTLMLSQFEFASREYLSWEQILQSPPLLISVKNYGQSPAILQSYAVQFTCEDLPEVLDYPPELFFDVGNAVETGKTIPLEADAVTPWGTFSVEDATAIATGKKSLTVYGYVLYGDVFGPSAHILRFCKMCGGLPDEVFWMDWPSPYCEDTQRPQRPK